MSLEGKRLLVTGGSAGLGAAIARKLASLGATCAINYASNDERAEALRNSLPGSGHILIKRSVFTKSEAHQVVQTAISELGGLDLIASNAGWTKSGEFHDLHALEDEDWDKCYAANVKSHHWIMQAAQQELAKNQGNFLITTSVGGLRSSGSSMAYCVSKAGAVHLTLCLAKVCAPNIIVNSIAPGLLETDWATVAFSAERLEELKNMAALKRHPTLEDCAELACTLLTTRSITGKTIEISSGLGGLMGH